MKENKYDDPVFFERYGQMERSKKGLEGAGEWEALEKLLPPLAGRRVLDLGCGYGWHCIYAAAHGASHVVGVDISQKMLDVARQKTDYSNVQYLCQPIEDVDFEPDSFELVFSSLAFHYLASFDEIAQKIYRLLRQNGDFIFSVEHPVFTAYGTQDWYYDAEGKILHFPVDHYFEEGKRDARFLGEKVVKYHRTLTTYLNGLLKAGFTLRAVVEPMPPDRLLDTVEGMRDELRRPMMLLIAASKSTCE